MAEHTETFWGDDPYLICDRCGQIRDALDGRVLRGSNGSCDRQREDERRD